MAAHQRKDRPIQSAHRNIEGPQQFTSDSVAGWQQLKWRQEQERAWEGNLRNLRQCIGELLLKNRELGNPPLSAINHRYRETDNEHYRNIARNRS
jgi:hypothetical protein